MRRLCLEAGPDVRYQLPRVGAAVWKCIPLDRGSALLADQMPMAALGNGKVMRISARVSIGRENFRKPGHQQLHNR